ncbi:L-serine ammonia-lyase [Salmonella enterica subsp. enterica]|uniref:L-serine ammonia-lyase n=1 Tax=Salmonella enterica I TaxID=59201 RepID=A0A379WSF7_SALET|nr:L-serine ammonia-lyase [Salmonella enterica subsp. enterica]
MTWSKKGLLDNVTRVAVDVYGSLSLTGKVTIPISPLLWVWRVMNPLPWILIVSPVLFATSKRASVCYWPRGRHEVDFPKMNGMRFHNGNLPLHENGCRSRLA